MCEVRFDRAVRATGAVEKGLLFIREMALELIVRRIGPFELVQVNPEIQCVAAVGGVKPVGSSFVQDGHLQRDSFVGGRAQLGLSGFLRVGGNGLHSP